MITPCVKKCKIDNGVCLGCGRTLEEIINWMSYSDQTRQDIIEKLNNKMRSL